MQDSETRFLILQNPYSKVHQRSSCSDKFFLVAMPYIRSTIPPTSLSRVYLPIELAGSVDDVMGVAEELRRPLVDR